jgi:CRISPR-associated protein Cas2
MRWVIAYDIESDTVRDRVATVLLGVGERVQYSVFECRFEPEELPMLLARLQRELGETKGNVRVYRLCSACAKEAVGIGNVRETQANEPFLVV